MSTRREVPTALRWRAGGGVPRRGAGGGGKVVSEVKGETW